MDCKSSAQGPHQPWPTVDQGCKLNNSLHGKSRPTTPPSPSGFATPYRTAIPSFPKQALSPPLCLCAGIVHLQLPASLLCIIPFSWWPLLSSVILTPSPNPFPEKCGANSLKSSIGYFPPSSCILTGHQIVLFSDNYSPWSPAGFWGKSPLEWLERGTFLELLTSSHRVVHSCVLKKSPAFKYSRVPW